MTPLIPNEWHDSIRFDGKSADIGFEGLGGDSTMPPSQVTIQITQSGFSGYRFSNPETLASQLVRPLRSDFPALRIFSQKMWKAVPESGRGACM